jgi:hypothetical protein
MNQAFLAITVSALTLFATRTLADSLCDNQERTLFSCISKNKEASICSSKVFSENAGYIRYLYGKHGSIELEYPNDRSPARKNFQWNVAWSPGENVYLKFSIGEFRYYVYSSQGESYSDRSKPNSIYHWEGGGIAIFRNTALLKNIKCTDVYIDTSTRDGKNEFELAKVPLDDEVGFNLWEKIP